MTTSTPAELEVIGGAQELEMRSWRGAGPPGAAWRDLRELTPPTE
jgi:hypothetical protein